MTVAATVAVAAVGFAATSAAFDASTSLAAVAFAASSAVVTAFSYFAAATPFCCFL